MRFFAFKSNVKEFYETQSWTETRALDEYEYRSLPESLPILHRDNVSIGQKINEGGQGLIYEGRLASPYSFNHEPVVVKKFKDLLGISQGHFPPQLWEYKCSNVCKPRGVFYDYDGESLCVVMDRYSSDLRKLIDSRMKGSDSPFPQQVAICIIAKIALGLRGLHECGIHHRDIKASNILVKESPNISSMVGASDMDYEVVITDFESSDNVIGTLFWRAPEVLQSILKRFKLHENQWQAADVYSFGMTCYEIMTGKIPFENELASNYNLVLSGNRPELPAYVGEPVKSIIQRCWQHDPTSRPSFAEIVCLLKDATPGLETMEEAIQKELSLNTPEAILWELVHQAEVYAIVLQNCSQRCRDNFKWAFEFICTVQLFVSKFGWDSFSKHPSLSFSQYIERLKLVSLITMQLESYATVDDTARNNEILKLMRGAYNSIIQGYWLAGYDHEDDGDLMLDQKLTIIEQALVEPLLNAQVCKKQILAVVVKPLCDLRRGNWRVYPVVEEFGRNMQSRLEDGSGYRIKCLQETLNNQGVNKLVLDSLFLSSIVFTLLRLVMAYRGKLFADLPGAGFRRSREFFMGFTGLHFIFQCLSPILQFKLFGWQWCLVWFLRDIMLGIFNDCSPHLYVIHILHCVFPLIAYQQQLASSTGIRSISIIIIICLFFGLSSLGMRRIKMKERPAIHDILVGITALRVYYQYITFYYLLLLYIFSA